MAEAVSEHVIVTGAGSGIGKELTKLFLADGATVLAVSLVPTELDELQRELAQYGQRLTTRVQDLSELDAAEKLVAYCEQTHWQCDTLVNNAGFGCYGDLVDTELSKLESMLRLNVITLSKLSALFGAKMRARRRGNILNVGSIAGMVATARFGSYSASKSYVNAFTFALRREMAPYNVNVTCLTPGPVSTRFAQTADIASYQGKSILKEAFAKGLVSTPDAIAKAGYLGLRAGKAHVLTGRGAVLAAMASRVFSPSVLPYLLRGA